MRDLEHKNIRALAEIVERYGTLLLTSQQDDLYRCILEKADAAATALKSMGNSNKIIKRNELELWLRQQLEAMEDSKKLIAKPYVKILDRFFSEFHSDSGNTIKNKSYIGLDVQYEMKSWRGEQLISYILRFLPEVVLTAHEIVFSDYLTFNIKLRECVDRLLKDGRLTASDLLPELMLHAAVRETTSSEPIGCKILHPNQNGSSCMRTAYIVHAAKSELWLGTALLAASSENDIVKKSIEEISNALNLTMLKDKRQLIIRLHEPEHLRPHSLGQALLSNSPIDQFTQVLRLPVMIAYDSTTLCAGFCEDYQDKLISEVRMRFNEMFQATSNSIEIIKIHVIFVPVDNVSMLMTKFLESFHAI
jgi:hypothetical protein